MFPLKYSKPDFGSVLAVLLPIGLWAMLWFSIQPGRASNIFDPESPVAFLHGLRVIFPFAAGWVAVVLIVARLYRQRLRGSTFIGPLGLTTIYGLVGLAAALLSPQLTTALYWAALYLSVPLVLFGVVWGADSLELARRLVQFNWLIIAFAVMILYFIDLIYLDQAQTFVHPSRFLRCDWGGNWFEFTSQNLRPTGVGRYAAIAAIISIPMLLQGKWRALWALVLFCSISLLLGSAARASIAGFMVAAPVVFLLAGGRKAALAAAVALVVLVPLVWSTGAHEKFLSTCILKGWNSSSLAELNLNVPAPSPDQNESVGSGQPPATVDFPSSSPEIGIIPEGFFTLTGRTKIWEEGWKFIKLSPILGYGFHADRLVLGTHMHNAPMHALIQTGLIGTIPFLSALLLGWFLLLKAVRNLNKLPAGHKYLLIQSAGITVFLSVRAIPESTGAFFGVDWLILAPLLLYLQVLNSSAMQGERTN